MTMNFQQIVDQARSDEPAADTATEPEATTEEANTPGDAPAEETPAEESTVEAYEIPGVGEFTADEIRAMVEAREKLPTVEARMAELVAGEKDLEAARSLQALLANPKFRAKVEAAIDEMDQDGSAETPAKADAGTSKTEDPRLDEVLKKMQVLDAVIATHQSAEIMAQRETVRAGYKAKYPDLVDDAVLDQIEQAGLKAHGKEFHWDHLEMGVLRHVADKGLKQAEKKAADSSAEKGRRTVLTPSATNGKTPEPAKALSMREIVAQARR